MKEKLQGILQTAKEQLAAAKDSRALDEARVKFLGKKGELTALLKAGIIHYSGNKKRLPSP